MHGTAGQAVTGRRSGVWDWSIYLWHAESAASKHPGAPVTDPSIDRGRAEPDRRPSTLPVVHHIWEHRLPLAPGATVLIGENGSGRSMLIEATAAAFRDDWLQQTLAGPERITTPIRSQSHGEGFLQATHSWWPRRTTCVTSADLHQSVVPRPLAHRRDRVLPTVGACPAEAVL